MQHLVSAASCDSVATLHLIVNPNVSTVNKHSPSAGPTALYME
jgi:hypothetical protein